MNEDILLLRGFVTNVYHWLRYCYLGRQPSETPSPWPVIQIQPELVDLAVPAWHEFEKMYSLDTLLASLDADRDGFQEILTSHGLLGAQLRYKLQLVEIAAQNVGARLKGWKRKLIDLIDNLLNSLGPTGIAGALKELKDALIGSLPDE